MRAAPETLSLLSPGTLARPLGLVAHADWSLRADKRWVCVAAQGPDGWRLDAPVPVGDVAEPEHLLSTLVEQAGGRAALVGLDAGLGLPAAWGQRAGVEAFLPFLQQTVHEAGWERFWEPAASREEISLQLRHLVRHSVPDLNIVVPMHKGAKSAIVMTVGIPAFRTDRIFSYPMPGRFAKFTTSAAKSSMRTDISVPPPGTHSGPACHRNLSSRVRSSCQGEHFAHRPLKYTMGISSSSRIRAWPSAASVKIRTTWPRAAKPFARASMDFSAPPT